jgi:hypothetical protein
MVVELLSLESVRIASDSCALLRDLIERKSRQLPPVGNVPDLRYWRCPQMDLLSLVAGVALELHKIKHDLFPRLVQEATLEGGFLKALLLLKNSAVALVRLAKDAKEIVERCVELMNEEDDVLLGKEDDVLLGQVGKVEKVGNELKDTADLVLEGTQNIAWLQSRLPSVLEVVDVLLSTPVRFPDSQLFLASS